MPAFDTAHSFDQPSKFVGRNLSPLYDGQDLNDLLSFLPESRATPNVKLDTFYLDEGFVLFRPGCDGIIFDKHGEVVVSTTSYATDVYKEYDLPTLRSQARSMDGPYYVAVDSGWWNYYHWLILILAKAGIVATILPRACQFILPDLHFREHSGYPARFSKEVWRQTLSRFGLFQRSKLVRDGVYRINGIYFASTNQSQPAYITYMNQLYDFFETVARDIGTERITRDRCVIRRLSDGRLNEKYDTVFNLLCRHHNFRSVYLEEMSFYEQVDVFAKSKIIIAPHGAGLSNLVFSRPGLKVLELNSFLDGEQVLRPWFFILADGLGQSYRYVNISSTDMSPDDTVSLIEKYESL